MTPQVGEDSAFGGTGQRDHSWGVRDWWQFPWNWTSGHFEDGSFVHAARSIIPGLDIFATGYMHGDPGYPRYFAEVALFVFSMFLFASLSYAKRHTEMVKAMPEKVLGAMVDRTPIGRMGKPEDIAEAMWQALNARPSAAIGRSPRSSTSTTTTQPPSSANNSAAPRCHSWTRVPRT